MNRVLLENGLIENCAPTLAGIKMGNLFNHPYQTRQTAQRELRRINEQLNTRGVYAEPLLWREKTVLVYVYRPKMLQEVLADNEAAKLLSLYGYTDLTVKGCIRHLKKRLYHYDCFPHEIGVFLGYPLDDVKGFIENKGKNCKSCGMWKVYCNEKEKQKLFRKFKKCTEVYIQVFARGRALSQMTVLS